MVQLHLSLVFILVVCPHNTCLLVSQGHPSNSCGVITRTPALMDFLQENVTFKTRVPSEWQLNWQELSGENNFIKS